MFDHIGHALHNLSEKIEGWRRYNRAYNELLSLDDRTLADIGVTRAEIPFILTHANDETRAGTAANENSRRAA